jgi:hypothetical protein
MLYTQNIMPFLMHYISVLKMQCKTLCKRNSAVVLKVLYTKFHFYTTDTLRKMANFPQNRGNQHKKLKCLKKEHQTLYCEKKKQISHKTKVTTIKKTTNFQKRHKTLYVHICSLRHVTTLHYDSP